MRKRVPARLIKRILAALAFCGALTLSVRLLADVVTVQATIGSGTNTQVFAGGSLPCKWIEFQNNTADVMRIGDSSTSSTRGLQLQPGVTFMEPPLQQPNTYDLSKWYVAGTTGDKLDVACESQ